ncbi:hypothetical protein MKW94_003488 [Papaver nudicaule]|uniref:Uncharacterized protein n=1 Tax=Papaver nudicaule TaxID=74823 RepID=A0AA41V8S7_PAPNU|nr:hypothetical protein [Papaver nudicaule]
MAVRIRFSRLGCRHRPFYRVGQDGGKRMGLKFDRLKAGVLPPPPMLAMSHKSGPRDARPVDSLTDCFVNPAGEPTNTDQPKGSESAELNSKSLNIATLFDKYSREGNLDNHLLIVCNSAGTNV